MKQVIVKLTGGLGNQFFQYAFGKSIKKRIGKKVKYDTYIYDHQDKRQLGLDNFYINYARWNKAWETLYRYAYSSGMYKLFGIQEEEKAFAYCEPQKGRFYFVGYWQNVKYLEACKEELRRELVYKYPLSQKQQELLNQISEKQSIAIHIRRGDYLEFQRIHHVVAGSYYHKSVKVMQEKVQGDRVFHIFSDDIAWCKDNIRIPDDECIFIDSTISDSPYVDFELMRNCKHFIISNSTFSWWASFLASYEDKRMIAPQIWYNASDLQESVIEALLQDYELVEE